MIGYLRYFLAALVVYSHLNYPLWNILGIKINQGVLAVFAFYIISGFFTAAIFDRHRGENQVRNFYIDRSLRIYPLFLLVITITGLIGIFHYEPSLRASAGDYRTLMSWWKGFLQPFNGLISFFFAGDFPYGPFFAFTPVASLALEVNYFFIYPALRRCGYRTIVLIVAISTIILVESIHNGNAGEIERYSYRFLIGVLPTFLSGYLIYRNLSEPAPIWLRGWLVSGIVGVLLLASIYHFNAASTKWVGEMALALIFTPALLIFSLQPKPIRYDALMGYLAYGIFLSHIPVIRYMNIKLESGLEVAYVLFIATPISLMMHFILERHVTNLRHKLSKASNIQISSRSCN